MTDLIEKTSEELSVLFKSHAASPVELFKECAERVERFNPLVNAFAVIDLDLAEKRSKESETRWKNGTALSPIDGIPTTIKDVLYSSDWETSYGSHVFKTNGPSDQDSPCVARLKEAGTIILGVTTSPEIGWKGVTDSPRYGSTLNPWDTEKTPGGSSGGAAACAALKMGLLHIGSDGGGSIRIPSSFSGVFGHKPSFGLVPAYPASAFGTVSHVGPIAATVQDAAQMLNIISKPDARDWYTLPYTAQNYKDGITEGVKGKRIAYCAAFEGMRVDAEVAECVAKEVQSFEKLGAHIEEVALSFPNIQEIFHTLWFAGAAKRISTISDSEKKLLDPGILEIVDQANKYTLDQYLEAVRLREIIGVQMKKFHENYDFLITPTMPITAFAAGQETPQIGPDQRWTDWTGFTYPFNLTQQPACSIPCGLDSKGLPIGMQIIGPMHADAAVLKAAYAYEQTRDWLLPNSPIVK